MVILVVGGAVTAIALLSDDSNAPAGPIQATASTESVEIEVTGNGPTEISYTIDGDTVERAIHAVPYKVTVASEPGETVTVTATPAEPARNATCIIRVGGQLRDQKTSNSSAQPAICSTTV